MPAVGSVPGRADTCTMEPLPRWRMYGSTAWLSHSAAPRLTSIMTRRSSGVAADALRQLVKCLQRAIDRDHREAGSGERYRRGPAQLTATDHHRHTLAHAATSLLGGAEVSGSSPAMAFLLECRVPVITGGPGNRFRGRGGSTGGC